MDRKKAISKGSGPSGWAEFNGGRFDIDGWEMLERNPEDPNQRRGWFRCSSRFFAAQQGDELLLTFLDGKSKVQSMDVTIEYVNTTEPIWEFRALA